MKDHEVVMIFGDNLKDHSDDFKGGSITDRKAAVDTHTDKWGISFIVLPNTMYGEWEGTAYGYNWKATDAEKVELRKKALNYWNPQ